MQYQHLWHLIVHVRWVVAVTTLDPLKHQVPPIVVVRWTSLMEVVCRRSWVHGFNDGRNPPFADGED